MELSLKQSSREQTKERLKQFLAREMGEVQKLHAARKESGTALSHRRAEVIDKLIRMALKEAGYSKFKGLSIVALGGYGRREFCPYSDVDLLLLYDPKEHELAEEVSENILYMLWDLNLDLGHSVRTVDECIDLSTNDDIIILTSLMDSRWVYGDKKLFGRLEEKIYKGLLPKISSSFIEDKLKEYEDRLDRFGRSVYLSEPHVKEGDGTLRDINTALWIAKAKYKIRDFSELLQKTVLSEKDIRGFEKGLDFMLTVRSELHYQANRREDVLGFEWQEKVAHFLGYKNMGEVPAVERFMRIFYLHANLIKEHTEKLIAICTKKPRLKFRADSTRKLEHGFITRSGKLNVASAAVILDHPENMMRAFELADHQEIELGTTLKELIRGNLNLIDDKVRRNPELNASFLRILKKGKNVSKTLFEMNKIRLLGHYIPEFGKIVCLAQHDAYHVYPVDIHSIFMVEEIERRIRGEEAERFPLITLLAQSTQKRHILYLACLLHDAGKGQGRDHSKRGSVMVPYIAERMGLPHQELKQLQFLVRQHLIMPHIAQRRDMHDLYLILQFAKLLRTVENLQLLYLLTFSDIRSVGPEVWTNWKGMLLKELYQRTEAVLEGRKKPLSPDKHAKKITKKVIESLTGETDRERAIGFLDGMPSSYFNVFDKKTIAYHVRTLEKFGEETGIDVTHDIREGFDVFIFWGREEVGIFSKLCGVLSASGLNILGARIVTREDGRILDVFYVNKNGSSTYEDASVWVKVRKNLFDVLNGKVKVERLVKKRQRDESRWKKEVPKLPTKIEFDNESSSTDTVIDIYTHDREGLLYQITKTLSDLGISINYAKISTKVDQAADVFYVCDSREEKLLDRTALEEVKKALLKSIEEG